MSNPEPKIETRGKESGGTAGYKAVLRRIEKAEQHVLDLCSGKEKWTMRIPVQEDRDSDCLIMQALIDAKEIIKAL